jgi:hypothetical protein
MIGVLGNISDEDLRRTIMTAPQLCRPGATLLWSRATIGTERNAPIRALLAESGFTELDYLEVDQGENKRAALGSARYGGPLQPLITDQQIFTFMR